MTDLSRPYQVSVSVPGAWWCRLQVPLDPYETVCAVLEQAARALQVAVTAVLRGSAGDVVEVILLRDPSRRYGVAPVPVYDQLAATLAATAGWRRRTGGRPPGVVVPLGLRRGYDPHAPAHSAAAARRWLGDLAPASRSWPVRLCSVRILPDGPQWWHEPGLLILGRPEHVSALDQIAAELGQLRYVITDATTDTTVVHRGVP
uniref:hypothetical protein n=1 Tax=Amycolatopsis sp. CA-151526 TaxID=3239921 RepID=UPI003F492E27